MANTRSTSLFVLAMSLASLTALNSAAAAPQAKKLHKSQPVPPSRAAPDVTATIPPRTSQKPPSPSVDDEALPPPFFLPAAPRKRIRACGQRWDDIKMAGAAGNQTWREFATQCLSQPDLPAKAEP